MSLKAQKRMAAEILKCGENRVYFDPYLIDEIKMAITREYRKNLLHERRKKGRARGIGKRKGTKRARFPKKKMWMNRIRPQRRELKKLRDRKSITTATYRKLYKNAKGGMFASVAQMNRYIKEKDLIRRGR
ncbi:MAG: 50S ribosomal protein L19e domain-containing protein [Promethearchaeota archaeon]